MESHTIHHSTEIIYFTEVQHNSVTSLPPELQQRDWDLLPSPGSTGSSAPASLEGQQVGIFY